MRTQTARERNQNWLNTCVCGRFRQGNIRCYGGSQISTPKLLSSAIGTCQAVHKVRLFFGKERCRHLQ